MLASLSLVAACATEPADDGGISKEEAQQQSDDGKSDGIDWCELRDWYDDGDCDRFCARHDNDCPLLGPDPAGTAARYPIIVHHYPGPQGGSVGSRSFLPSRGDTRALAELGFIVIQLDGMGLPGRTKSFHDAYYGNMGDNGLPDQITGVRQLAQRHRWIDLDRVGIYGHSGGGYSSADAILRYPDFFKVAVSQAGNHDNRIYEDDWGEKWQGLLERRPNGGTNYDNQANQLLAQNLKGKLLIAWGTMDDNVPPNNSLVLIDELIRHNKDFDVIPFPNRRHGFGNEPYMMRRRWDYFVKHLLGAEPPREFEFRVAAPQAR